MPNGGIRPSCFLCEWATKSEDSIHKANNSASSTEIYCRKHGFTVRMPLAHLCADLKGYDENNGLSTIIKKLSIENGFIYAWLELNIKEENKKIFPLYHHELIKLVEFQEYSKLSNEDKQKAYNQAKNKREQEINKN